MVDPGLLGTGTVPVANALSVDVEDWFQVQAFAGQIDRASWDDLPSRVERNTGRILDLFAANGVKATFFVLGCIAERFPGLVGRIAAADHEIASHGWEHRPVHSQTPDQFRRDVTDTRRRLEDLGGCPVTGYRAASFSIDRRTPWAHTVLREAGYRYSSSVYPIRHDLYGMPDAPRFAFTPGPAGGVVELPLTTVALGRHRLPCSGGGYFRLMPYGVSRWALLRVNRIDRSPGIFYFHPWEIDPDQPRVSGATLRSRFRHYTNLGRMEARLRHLLADFRWDRVDRVFVGEIAGS